MNNICLITHYPNKIWCDFLNSFTHYTIYMIVDDNDYNIDEFINNYQNIHFIKIDNDVCEKAGFYDVNYVLHKKLSGWDKSLYFFSTIEFNNVWFIEDDVFFYNEMTLLNIDNKYNNDETLIKKYKTQNSEEWLWNEISIKYPKPHYYTMCCIVRFSKNILNYIQNYVTINKKLDFLEALFPTIIVKNNVNHKTPIEFNNITWINVFNTFNKNELYHPLKNLNDHIYVRKILDSKPH